MSVRKVIYSFTEIFAFVVLNICFIILFEGRHARVPQVIVRVVFHVRVIKIIPKLLPHEVEFAFISTCEIKLISFYILLFNLNSLMFLKMEFCKDGFTQFLMYYISNFFFCCSSILCIIPDELHFYSIFSTYRLID